MKHYERGDYVGAIPGLRKAASLDRSAPHMAFFLGVSHLLAAQPDDAVSALRRTIALGDSAYFEQAHFYLAKAYLSQGNTDEARQQLESTIRLKDERETQAASCCSSSNASLRLGSDGTPTASGTI